MALGVFIKPFVGSRSPLSPKDDFWQGGTTVAASLVRVAACRRFLHLLPPSTLKTSHHPALVFCCSSLTVFISRGDTDKLSHHSGKGTGNLSHEDLGQLSLTRADRGDNVTVLNLYRIVTGQKADMFYMAPEGRAKTDK